MHLPVCIECAFMHDLQAETIYSAPQVILAEDTFRPGEGIVVIKILNSRNAAAGRRVGCHAPAWATKGCCQQVTCQCRRPGNPEVECSAQAACCKGCQGFQDLVLQMLGKLHQGNSLLSGLPAAA